LRPSCLAILLLLTLIAVLNIYQSNGACQQTCGGYAFAVVQYQNCWCSNYVPAHQVSVNQCNLDCPGFPDEKCGNQDQGLYGYVQLASPSGTAGGSSSATSTTQTSSSTSYTPPSSTTYAKSTSGSSTSYSVSLDRAVNISHDHDQHQRRFEHSPFKSLLPLTITIPVVFLLLLHNPCPYTTI